MDAPFLIIAAIAIIALAGGIKMMYCGHEHAARRDRRSTDKPR